MSLPFSIMVARQYAYAPTLRPTIYILGNNSVFLIVMSNLVYIEILQEMFSTICHIFFTK